MERLPRSCLSFWMPFSHVGRVPENNRGNDQAQAICPVLLVLEGPVSQFAETIKTTARSNFYLALSNSCTMRAISSSPHETFKSYAMGETKRDILRKTRLCTTFRHSPKTYQSSAVRPSAPSVSRLLPA